ncbi:MAG: hypothetical protein R6X20_07355 [Phycisphaerae bacterium]
MDCRDRIIEDLAESTCGRICRRAIRALQDIDFAKQPDAKLSGDDSVLANTWDEICVQVQHEKSFFWEAYEDTMLATIQHDVECLLTHEAQAIWLQTYAGEDWAHEHGNEGEVPVCNEEIEHYVLRNYVLSEADSWSNPRIRKYLGE